MEGVSKGRQKEICLSKGKEAANRKQRRARTPTLFIKPAESEAFAEILSTNP